MIRLTSILTCGLASILMLAHTIIPHEHEFGQEDAAHSHCTAFELPSHCDHESISHFHPGADEDEQHLCLLSNVITVRKESITLVLKRSVQKSGNTFLSQAIRPCLLHTATAPGILSPFPDAFSASLREKHSHSNTGLRAPPLV